MWPWLATKLCLVETLNGIYVKKHHNGIIDCDVNVNFKNDPRNVWMTAKETVVFLGWEIITG